MEVVRTINADGSSVETIALTAEEEQSINLALSIISKRFKNAGVGMSSWEASNIRYRLLGILRENGAGSMVHWAESVRLVIRDRHRTRGYY